MADKCHEFPESQQTYQDHTSHQYPIMIGVLRWVKISLKHVMASLVNFLRTKKVYGYLLTRAKMADAN